MADQQRIKQKATNQAKVVIQGKKTAEDVTSNPVIVQGEPLKGREKASFTRQFKSNLADEAFIAKAKATVKPKAPAKPKATPKPKATVNPKAPATPKAAAKPPKRKTQSTKAESLSVEQVVAAVRSRKWTVKELAVVQEALEELRPSPKKKIKKTSKQAQKAK